MQHSARTCRRPADCRLREVCYYPRVEVGNGVYELRGNQTALQQGYCQCPHSPFGLSLDCHTGTWRSDVLSIVSMGGILVHMWYLSVTLRALDREFLMRRKRPPRKLFTLILYAIVLHSLTEVCHLLNSLLYVSDSFRLQDAAVIGLGVALPAQLLSSSLVLCLLSYLFLHGLLIQGRMGLPSFLLVVIFFGICNVVLCIAAIGGVAMDERGVAIAAGLSSRITTLLLFTYALCRAFTRRRRTQRSSLDPEGEEGNGSKDDSAEEGPKKETPAARKKTGKNANLHITQDPAQIRHEQNKQHAKTVLALGNSRPVKALWAWTLIQVAAVLTLVYGPLVLSWFTAICNVIAKACWSINALKTDEFACELLVCCKKKGMRDTRYTSSGKKSHIASAEQLESAIRALPSPPGFQRLQAQGGGNNKQEAVGGGGGAGAKGGNKEEEQGAMGPPGPGRPNLKDKKSWLPESKVVEKQAKYYVPTPTDVGNFNFYKKQMIQKLSTVMEASLQSRDSRGLTHKTSRSSTGSRLSTGVNDRSEAHYDSVGGHINHHLGFMPQGKVRVVVDEDTEEPTPLGPRFTSPHVPLPIPEGDRDVEAYV